MGCAGSRTGMRYFLLLFLIAQSAFGDFASTIAGTQAASLKGYWKCNETSGTSLVDSSGNSKTLTITGTVTTDYVLNQTGEQGAAIQWKGTAGYASRTDSVLGAALATQDFTFLALVKSVGTTQTIVMAIASHTSSSPQVTLGQLGSLSKAEGFVDNDPNTQSLDLSGGTAFDGSWHLVVYTRSGTTFTLYVDGTSVATNTLTLGNCSVTRTSIGAGLYNIPTFFYNGYMQHAAIWSVALSGAEITAIQSARSGATPAPSNFFIFF